MREDKQKKAMSEEYVVVTRRKRVKDDTINDAIEHLHELLEKDDFGCEECRREHEELLSMLRELRDLRKCA